MIVKDGFKHTLPCSAIDSDKPDLISAGKQGNMTW